MSITARTVRLLMPVAALLFLGLALLIRVVDDGALRQYSGTALYASMVWAGVLFLWPRMAPVPAGTVATVFCWVVECAQLTGVPAELSARSLAARLALGVQFDPVDLAWYPAGVAPLVVLHHLLRARTRPASRPPRDVVPPPAALPVDSRP
ncbi:DUF2809 domain-containing protein [Micromonospora sp. 4G57]|uniref:DUF2809 domain-containing protein n=1 Tax=Micromonospora sicca TaxID=2202420 RepID=A0ABU5J8S2_9ACTN|nr:MULTISPECIES: DUF2809 domain-containing protein [unclassified Micromonospora]MDZ5443546.1 DUF2809 domain-containing protein [Micromonospora sp. 4G57]MDZ5488981.1 DUF2809 domain-containing protein [Micromonospora sp. 4G53]